MQAAVALPGGPGIVSRPLLPHEQMAVFSARGSSLNVAFVGGPGAGPTGIRAGRYRPAHAFQQLRVGTSANAAASRLGREEARAFVSLLTSRCRPHDKLSASAATYRVTD